MMNKDNFELNGDWSYEIKLPAFWGFQERRGPYASISSELPASGLVTIEFEDDLGDNPDPYVEQLNTLDFIFNNQEKIVHAIIEKVLQIPEIRRSNRRNEKKYQHIEHDTVKSVMGIAAIVIKTVSKDYFSYYDIVCGCDWQKDGLNFLFHNERIVSLKTNTGISRWDALKDNGTYELFRNRPHQIEVPKKYTPHPKYNKLKPSQKFANDSYEHRLISLQMNEKFKNEVENGTIDINGKYESSGHTFLELAYWFKNNELIEFLLSKKADIRYALHECLNYAYSEEALDLLLKHGADINAYDKNGKTIIYKLVSALLYWIDDQYKFSKGTEFEQPFENPESFKQKIYRFIKSGADPNIRNRNGLNCFDIMSNASPETGIQVNDFLQHCLKEK